MNISFSERLDFWNCFFLDSDKHIVFKTFEKQVEVDSHPSKIFFPDDGEDISNQNYDVKDAHEYRCKAHGAFITGSEEGGRAVCILLCILISIVGLFGVITNLLNVILLQKSFPGKGPVSFKECLILLAVVDFVLCFATIGFSYFIILIAENLSRGQVTMHLFHICNLTFTLTRTISVYVTILITVERFFVIAFPIKSKEWLYNQPGRSRIILAFVLIFCVLINLPWIVKSSIVENEYRGGLERDFRNDDEDHLVRMASQELMDFPYLIKRNGFAKSFNRTVQEILLALDFVVPLPVLLIFNILLYILILLWNSKRVGMSGRQKRDIKTAKMFSVVVIVLLSCHSVSCVVFFTSRVQHVIYRELLLLQSLSVCLGAASNFMVYYWFGPAFQREFWGIMVLVFGERFDWINQHYEKFRKDSTEMSQYSVQQH